MLQNTSTPGNISFVQVGEWLTGGNPSAVETGDFNGDGKIDVAVSHASGSVIVLPNTSSPGTIQLGSQVLVAAPSGCGNLGIADFDGDGKPDMAVACGPNTLSVFKNTSTGRGFSFATPVNYSTSSSVRTVAVADIDGDGLLDVVTTGSTGTAIAVHRNIGNNQTIAFAPAIDMQSGGLSWWTSLADINGDGKPDLLVPNTDQQTLSIFSNTSTPGTIAFALRKDIPVGGTAMGGGVGDLDHDGLPDIVLSNFYTENGFSVFQRKKSILTHTISINDDCGGNAVLEFGLASGATSGLDTTLGEQILPPLPPTGAFDARFFFTDGLISSRTDYQSDTSTSPGWRIRFQPGACEYPVHVTWDSTSFAQWQWTLQDEITGDIVNVNMRECGSIAITDSRVISLKILLARKNSIEVGIKVGWNLLSVPVEVSDFSLSAVFPAVLSPAYAFEGEYISKTALNVGRGYWIRAESPAYVSLCGSAVRVRSIELGEGWNLIGPFETEVAVSAIQTQPAGIIQSRFFGFDGGYFPASTLVPGKGYWVRTSQSGVLSMGSAPQLAKTSSVVDSLLEIEVRDSTGKGTSLFIGRHAIPASLAAMPPCGPAEVADVRFDDDTWIHDSGRLLHEIRLTAMKPPLSITAHHLGGWQANVQDSLSSFNISLHENQPVTVNQAPGVLIIQSTNLTGVDERAPEHPASFELKQNFPNPFNPSTMIEFTLPAAGKARITVFDLLGREVQCLADGMFAAGTHALVFDAQHLPSGTYFYRLESQSNLIVKKMMLVK